MHVTVSEGYVEAVIVYSETDLMLVEVLQFIVDSLKDPSSFKLYSLESQKYLTSLGVKVDCSATNSYGAVVRTTYYLAYFDHGHHDWNFQLSNNQNIYANTWLTGGYVTKVEDAEKIFKKLNLYT